MKIRNLTLFTLLAFTLSYAGNLSAELASAKVLSIAGTATKVAANGVQSPLTKGAILKEGEAVITTALSSVDLIFSNGSEVSIDANTSVKIATLQQEAFSGGQSYEQLKADPSKSQTLLSLNYGDLSGHVKKLQEGSNFDIETPLGTAAIRGTRWQVRVTYNPARQEFSVSVDNIDGLIDFISKTGGITSLGDRTSVMTKYQSSQDSSDKVEVGAGRKITVTVPKGDPFFPELMKLINPPANQKKTAIITPTDPIDDNNNTNDFDIIVVSPEGPEPTQVLK